MKISVEVSDKELKEIRQFTGERKKGPAIRKLALEALVLRRREALLKRVASGGATVALPDWRAIRKDRNAAWT